MEKVVPCMLPANPDSNLVSDYNRRLAISLTADKETVELTGKTFTTKALNGNMGGSVFFSTTHRDTFLELGSLSSESRDNLATWLKYEVFSTEGTVRVVSTSWNSKKGLQVIKSIDGHTVIFHLQPTS